MPGQPEALAGYETLLGFRFGNRPRIWRAVLAAIIGSTVTRPPSLRGVNIIYSNLKNRGYILAFTVFMAGATKNITVSVLYLS
jgi:hypothetical protein